MFPKRTKNHSSCWRNANDGSKHPPKLQNEKIPPAEKCTFPETSFPHLLHNFRTFPIFLCNFYENLQQEYFTKIGRKLHTDAWRTIVSSCLVNHSWNGWNSLHLQIHAGKKKTCRKKIRKKCGHCGNVVDDCGNMRKLQKNCRYGSPHPLPDPSGVPATRKPLNRVRDIWARRKAGCVLVEILGAEMWVWPGSPIRATPLFWQCAIDLGGGVNKRRHKPTATKTTTKTNSPFLAFL